ncbi:UNVERIFIED_CONTAM: 60S ribosomal protein L30 [Sesamum radiatum]|uniref:60S ribosomal protein L30 n=1 Tax=Sesamum radiatum TaxID=300843 RepID=A0AAW2V9T7_SESRA
MFFLQKKTHESINNRLALVMKSGKYTLGYKNRTQNPPQLQREIDSYLQQLPTVEEIRDRVLRDARQSWSSPLQWQ